MPDTMSVHPTPDVVITDAATGYAINVPAEWQSPNMEWWRDRAMANRVMSARAANAIQLHDALWAFLNNQPEPAPDADVYRFDLDTQTYTRTDVRV